MWRNTLNAHQIVVTLVFLAVFSSTTAVADEWDKYKCNCDKVLTSHVSVTTLQLKQCVSMWIAYGNPKRVRARDKQALTNAFQSLYQQGIDISDEEAEFLAISAAGKINVRLKLSIRNEVSGSSFRGRTNTSRHHVSYSRASNRKRFVPPAVSSAMKKRAGVHVRKGVSFFKRGNRKAALAQYLKALDKDPGNLNALFNSAAEYAFMRNVQKCVEQLHKLVDIGGDKAFRYIGAARTDPDFDRIHDSIPYKRASGYARIKVVNSLGELGELEVDRISKTLARLDYAVASLGDDKQKNRESPVIWFKDASAPTAYLIKDVVVHPGTIMTKIDWDSEFDIIVSWGNKIVKKNGVRQPVRDYTKKKNLDPDKQMSQLRRRHEEVMRKPDDAARKVGRVVDTPKRAHDNVKRSIDRTKRTFDSVNRVFDKLSNPMK